MIFALYFSFLFFAAAASSLGAAYVVAMGFLLAALPFTRDIGAAGVWATGGLLLCGGLLFWRSRMRFPDWRAHRPFLVYLVLFTPLLIWQGAYVEIPADPVGVHLYRIGDWLRDRYIPFGAENNGFFSSTLYSGYALNAAAIALAPFARETAVEVVAAFNSLILAVAFYGAGFFFLRRSSAAVAALVCTQLVLGISVYSYFRYYTFAPTLFNMIAMLDAICLLYTLITRPTRAATWVLLTAFFFAAWLSHKQEAIFLFTAGTFTCFYLALPGVDSKHRGFFLGLGSLLCVGALVGAAVGLALGKIEPPDKGLLVGFIVLAKIKSLSLLMANPRGWHLRTTLNLSFLIAWAITCAWAAREVARQGWKKWVGRPTSFVFLLSQVPFAIAFFPPLATFYSLFFYNLVFYRIFYFSFVFFCLPLAVIGLYRQSRGAGRVLWALAVVLLVYGFFWGKDPRGRHFLARTHADETYRPWLPVYKRLAAMHIPKSKKNPGEIVVYTDAVTAYPLNFFAGLTSQTCYLWRCDFPRSTGETERTLAGFQRYLGTQDYFLFNTHREFVPSRFTGHWPADIRDTTYFYDPALPGWVKELQKAGKLTLIFVQDGFEFYKVDFENPPI